VCSSDLTKSQLEAEVSALRTATVGEIRSDVGNLRNALKEVRELAEGAQKKAESTKSQLEAEVSALRTAAVGEIRSDVGNLRNALREVKELAEGVQKKAEAELSALRNRLFPPPPPGWNSTIVPEFPKHFKDFKEKQFTLLWRGSRDGFGAGDFHRRCDGRPNTLTVILDTNGNIFGGFTPVAWESRPWNGNYDSENNCLKADPSLKSFIFTLKNPYNVRARRFALKAEI
jgi:hypothetical protein